ncbi:L,D-transpeptidase [Eubacteriales bacterium KG127]
MNKGEKSIIKKFILFALIFVVITVAILLGNYFVEKKYDKNTDSNTSPTNLSTEEKLKSNEINTGKHFKANPDLSSISKSELWKYPTGSYPDLSSVKALNILVDTNRQIVSILDENMELTRFVVSTGIKDGESETPKGSFFIEPERGESFFAAEFGEGANYWVSFKGHGIYLFHSVPTDVYGNYIENEAAKLGTPSSHGCVRMSVPDAKWFYENIPTATPIKII